MTEALTLQQQVDTRRALIQQRLDTRRALIGWHSAVAEERAGAHALLLGALRRLACMSHARVCRLKLHTTGCMPTGTNNVPAACSALLSSATHSEKVCRAELPLWSAEFHSL